MTAAREVEEETGWRPRNVKPLVTLQPTVGMADAETLLFVAEGADHVSDPADINEAERVDWVRLDSVQDRIADEEIVGAASQVGLLHVLAYPHRRSSRDRRRQSSKSNRSSRVAASQ